MAFGVGGTVGPDHAAGDFVADLNIGGQGIGAAKSHETIAIVFVHSIFELREGEVCPGLGLFLMSGIGPGVGVMKI